MAAELAVTKGWRPDGTATVSLVGEIDLSNAAELRAACAGDGPLAVDLSEVDYLDSAGIAVLFEAAARRPLEVVSSPQVMPVLVLTRLADLAQIVEAGDSGGTPPAP